jgi:hypothetical protein
MVEQKPPSAMHACLWVACRQLNVAQVRLPLFVPLEVKCPALFEICCKSTAVAAAGPSVSGSNAPDAVAASLLLLRWLKQC